MAIAARSGKRRTEVWAVVALVAVTAIWGSTFVVVKYAIARMPVLDFLAWRFGLATVAMAMVRPRSVTRLPPGGRTSGVVLGLALGVGYLCQTFGLRTTPASVSGFITGMFVVFTPIIAWLLRRDRVGQHAWLAVGVATLGLGLISLRGFSIGSGEALTVGCAVCFALHIVGLGRWSGAYDSLALAVVQLLTVSVLCIAAAAGTEGLALPPDAGVWGAIALTALAATAIAFLVQTWAQRHLEPTRTAIVLTMEPAFAGIFGVWLGGDRLGVRVLVGAALVLAAMVLTELGPRQGAEGGAERLEL